MTFSIVSFNLINNLLSFESLVSLLDNLIEWDNFQNLFRNLYPPSIDESDHSKFCSGGAANKMKNLIVSAPYFFMIISGSTVLPLDFDILAPSLRTIP